MNLKFIEINIKLVNKIKRRFIILSQTVFLDFHEIQMIKQTIIWIYTNLYEIIEQNFLISFLFKKKNCQNYTFSSF